MAVSDSIGAVCALLRDFRRAVLVRRVYVVTSCRFLDQRLRYWRSLNDVLMLCMVVARERASSSEMLLYSSVGETLCQPSYGLGYRDGQKYRGVVDWFTDRPQVSVRIMHVWRPSRLIKVSRAVGPNGGVMVGRYVRKKV